MQPEKKLSVIKGATKERPNQRGLKRTAALPNSKLMSQQQQQPAPPASTPEASTSSATPQPPPAVATTVAPAATPPAVSIAPPSSAPIPSSAQPATTSTTPGSTSAAAPSPPAAAHPVSAAAPNGLATQYGMVVWPSLPGLQQAAVGVAPPPPPHSQIPQQAGMLGGRSGVGAMPLGGAVDVTGGRGGILTAVAGPSTPSGSVASPTSPRTDSEWGGHVSLTKGRRSTKIRHSTGGSGVAGGGKRDEPEVPCCCLSLFFCFPFVFSVIRTTSLFCTLSKHVAGFDIKNAPPVRHLHRMCITFLYLY